MVECQPSKLNVVGSRPITRSKGDKMDMLDIWNELGWTDGVLFSVWLGIMYYCKAWIDHRFKEKKDES